MWTIDSIASEVARNEGGFVDDPDDRGGATNHGITMTFARAHPEIFDANHDGTVSYEEIRHMPVEAAKRAYIEVLWQPYAILLLPNVANVLVQVCDMAMYGPRQAIKTLQHAVGATVDGKLGPGTMAAVNDLLAKKGAEALNNAIVQARCDFYDMVVAAHPTDKKFINGWKARALRYKV